MRFVAMLNDVPTNPVVDPIDRLNGGEPS